MQQAPDGKVIIIIANGAIDRVFGDARHPIRVSMDESNEQRVACSLRDDLSYRSFESATFSRSLACNQFKHAVFIVFQREISRFMIPRDSLCLQYSWRKAILCGSDRVS